MQRVMLTALALSISACSSAPTAGQVETAVAGTMAAMATPTSAPTEPPILDGNRLEPLLFQDGDLPSRFEPNQYTDLAPEGWPAPELYRGLDFIADNFLSEGVQVGIYDDPAPALEELRVLNIRTGAPYESIPDYGERAVIAEDAGGLGPPLFIMLWAGCRYTVRLHIFGYTNRDAVETYARRLNERLVGVVCP